MATAQKPKNTPQNKKTTASKQSESKSSRGKTSESVKRQKAAIVLMATAVFLIFVVFIEGESVWNYLHTGMFGLFGFCAYVWPLMLIYMSAIYAMDKPMGSVAANLTGTGTFVALLGSAIHIFSNTKEYINTSGNFGTQVVDAWNNETLRSGGVFGAFIGGLLSKLFGRTGAGITVIILLAVVLMLLTGTTVFGLFRTIYKPVKKVGELTNEKLEQSAIRREQELERKAEEKKFSPPKAPTFSAPEISKSPEPLPVTSGKAPEIPFVKLPDASVPAAKAVQAAVEDAEKPKKRRLPKKLEADEPTVSALEADAAVGDYVYPPIDCLNLISPTASGGFGDEMQMNARILIDTLESFNIKAEITDVCRGPSVTRYELVPQAGVRINKITNLSDDLALRLAASGVRIEAPIPNKSAIGIEVPNKSKSMVGMREIIDTPKYREAKSKLNVALGKDITGNIICADLAKMPHLLIAGTTGSGKSVCLNSMIISILFNASPDEVKLLMIDPKQVEFTVYNGIAHLEVPVVADPRKAAGALGWAVSEMQRRYKLFSENNVRDIGGFNKLVMRRDDLKPLHQIVIFIDELSDLMMVAPNEVEDSICRLAQMARAAGMHLVIATQRPSVDVITGIIKANIPSRIALSVSSQIDSRTILDTAGAEKLLGNGDMLFSPVGKNKPVRVQGCFISDGEVEKVVEHIKKQAQTTYNEETMQEINQQAAQTAVSKKRGGGVLDGDSGEQQDEMLVKAIEVVVELQAASTTMLQKKLKLGYARASRIMDELEEKGIVGPSEGAKPRSVLISKQQWYEMNALNDGVAPSLDTIAAMDSSDGDLPFDDDEIPFDEA